VFSVSQGSAEGEVEKYRIFRLLAFWVIFLPNITKIRLCFREL